MLDSDSSTISTTEYDEVYAMFTDYDLEDVIKETAKQPMTVKEECEAIEKLKSENFNLKWRLYLLNQDYKELMNGNNGGGGLGSKQSSENGSVKNLNAKGMSTKDKEIKMLRAVLEQRVKQLYSLKNYYEEIVKGKQLELDDLKMEKTSAYVTELECNAAALYEIITEKDRESNELKERLENQKNEIKKLKDDLKQLTHKLADESNATINNQTSSVAAANTTRLSLEQTRKELDQVKFELKNQKIREKEKLDNYAKIVNEKEVEIELLKEQIISLKERENYLQKETEQLQKDNEQMQKEFEQLAESEEELVSEIKRLKLTEEHLLKENQEYEQRIKEDYLIKKKQHLLKEKNQQNTSEVDSTTLRPKKNIDENSNLIKNSIDVQELFKYTKNLEERLDYQEKLLQKNENERQQLMLTLNKEREKKRNLENIISKQLAKTNHILATAKQNLIN